jgi:hypothetical protein
MTKADSTYTIADGLADGSYHRFTKGVVMTDNVARREPEARDLASIISLYRLGIYATPVGRKDGDEQLAVYTIDGTTYWVQRDSAYGELVIMLPEDY